MSSCFQQPIDGDPQAIFGWMQRNIVLGNPEAVLRTLSSDSYPTLAGRTRLVGIALFNAFYEKGEAQRMVAALQQTGLLNKPEMAEGFYIQAQKAVAANHDEVGEALYWVVVGMDFSDAHLRIKLARVLFEQYDDKVGTAEQLLRVSNPDTLSFQEVMDMAALLRQVGHYQEARNWVAQASTMDTSSLRPLIELGYITMAEEHYTELEQIAKQVISKDPNIVAAYALLGVAYAAQGNLDQAIQAEQKAIALNPKAPWPYSLLGSYLEGVGDKVGAETEFQQAITLDTEEVSYVVLLADLLTDQGRDNEAIILYQRALQMRDANTYMIHIQNQLKLLTK
jgi:tetratricopeptide (TPR) repeat protein